MNYGYELSFDAYLFPRGNDFQIQVQPSITQNINMVTKLPNNDRDYISKETDGYRYGYTVGKSGPIFYGMNYLGPIDNLDDLPVDPFTGKPLDPTKDGTWGTAKPGYPLWEDVNGDFKVDDHDYLMIDKNSNPKIQGYLNLHFSYKQWKLRVNSEFTFGRDIYDEVSRKILDRYDRGSWDTKASLDLSDYSIWTGEGSGGYYPSLQVSAPGEAGRYGYRSASSMWWENGSYWKIRDITLSHNFKQSWMKTIGFDRIYVYGTIYNVWQWQASNTVIDASAVDSRGVTYGDGYPQARKFVFGLNVQF